MRLKNLKKAEFLYNLLSVMGIVNILIKLTSHAKMINGGK